MKNDNSSPSDALSLSEEVWSCNDELIEQLWKEFQSLFPCEASVRKSFCSIMKAKYLLYCKYCFSDRLKINTDNRTYRCSDCHKLSSVTAGTFFQGARKLRAWFAAIWFIEQGAFISSARFSHLLEVRQSSGWGILRSVFAAIDMHARSRGFTARSIGSFHFMEIFCKRSLLTPRWEMPQSEEYFQRHLCKSSSSSVPFPTDNVTTELMHETNHTEADLNELAIAVLNCLFKCDLSFDSLLGVLDISERELLEVLTDLELSGLIVAVAGCKFQLTKQGSSLLNERTDRTGESSFDSDSSENSQDLNSSAFRGASGGEYQEFSDSNSGGSFSEPEPDGFKSSILDALEFERPDLDCWERSKLRDVPLLQQKANDYLLRECGIFGCEICAERSARLRKALGGASDFIGFMNKNGFSCSRKYLQIIISVERYRNKTLAKGNRTKHDWHGQASNAVRGFLPNPLAGENGLTAAGCDSIVGSRESLFDVCIASGYVRRNLLRGFVTPLLVNC